MEKMPIDKELINANKDMRDLTESGAIDEELAEAVIAGESDRAFEKAAGEIDYPLSKKEQKNLEKSEKREKIESIKKYDAEKVAKAKESEKALAKKLGLEEDASPEDIDAALARKRAELDGAPAGEKDPSMISNEIRGISDQIEKWEKMAEDAETPEDKEMYKGFADENRQKLEKLRKSPEAIKKYDAEMVEKAKQSEAELAAKHREEKAKAELEAKTKEALDPRKFAESSIKYWENDLKTAKTEDQKLTAQRNLDKYKKDLAALTPEPTPANDRARRATTENPEPGRRTGDPAGNQETPRADSSRASQSADRTAASASARTYNNPSADSGSFFSSNFEDASDWFNWLRTNTEDKLKKFENLPKEDRARFVRELINRSNLSMKALKFELKRAKKSGNKLDELNIKMRMKQEKEAFREFNKGAFNSKLMGFWRYVNIFRHANRWLRSKPLGTPKGAEQTAQNETPTPSAETPKPRKEIPLENFDQTP